MKLSTFTVAASFLLAANALVIRDGCQIDDDCEGDNYCKNGQCRALGDTCGSCDTNDDCRDELTCSNGVCGSCTTPGLTPDPTPDPTPDLTPGPTPDPTPTPSEGKGEGEDCESNDECLNELACLSSKCTKLSGVGGPCRDNDWCENALTCTENKCVDDNADPTPTPIPLPTDTISPDMLSRYWGDSGKVEYNYPSGYITKGYGEPTSALVTFTYPPWTAGKQCKVYMKMTNSYTISAGESREVDIFSSLQPATPNQQWNNRNSHLGRLRLMDGGMAAIVMELPGLRFPCPSGQTLGYEIVGTGDRQNVQWYQSPSDGVFVQVA